MPGNSLPGFRLVGWFWSILTVMNWPLYEQIVTQVFEPLVEDDGIPDTELDAAEARLGITLPAVLRQLYSLCGRRGDLHQACENLVLPPLLHTRDGYLVFYQNINEEKYWAVRVDGGDDPPVFLGNAGAWEPDYPSLSAFLLAMLFWQGVKGGMPYCAQGNLLSATIAQVAAGAQQTPLGGAWKLEALWCSGLMLVYSTEETTELRQVLCGYSEPQVVNEQVLPGVTWEQQGRRTTQVRFRNHDLSSRCAGCGRSKLTWADTSRGICARCGHPL